MATRWALIAFEGDLGVKILRTPGENVPVYPSAVGDVPDGCSSPENICIVEMEGGAGSTAEQGGPVAKLGPLWQRSITEPSGCVGFSIEYNPEFRVGADVLQSSPVGID